MKTPLIFDIKRASATDGPGVRTVVFFKGCNLDCYWCHNPEGKSAYAQMAFSKERCISCGECRKACDPENEECIACGRCAEYCPTGAKKLYGKSYSADALFEILQKDRVYYDATGGGVTFSGGECMLYPEYLAQLAKLCQEDGISVAIDTAGDVPYENFEKILPYADLFLYDIKAIDPELHRVGTGRDNAGILSNLDRLQQAGAHLLIRTPAISDFNEGEELERIRNYCRQRGLSLEILPYHPLGEGKKDALKENKAR